MCCDDSKKYWKANHEPGKHEMWKEGENNIKHQQSFQAYHIFLLHFEGKWTHFITRKDSLQLQLHKQARIRSQHTTIRHGSANATNLENISRGCACIHHMYLWGRVFLWMMSCVSQFHTHRNALWKECWRIDQAIDLIKNLLLSCRKKFLFI